MAWKRQHSKRLETPLLLECNRDSKIDNVIGKRHQPCYAHNLKLVTMCFLIFKYRNCTISYCSYKIALSHHDTQASCVLHEVVQIPAIFCICSKIANRHRHLYKYDDAFVVTLHRTLSALLPITVLVFHVRVTVKITNCLHYCEHQPFTTVEDLLFIVPAYAFLSFTLIHKKLTLTVGNPTLTQQQQCLCY